jgi:capsular polysaccharide biosynthesis protein
MSEQALDLRRSAQILRRHKIALSVATLLGIAAGVALVVLSTPVLTSSALVVLPTSAARYITTQVVIAGSDPVLTGALRQLDQPTSLQALQSRVQARSLSPTIISISAQGKTAEQAEDTATAVANSYVDYLSSAKNPGLRMSARIFQPAVNATGTSMRERVVLYGFLGALVGALIGSIALLAIGRNPRRLRERDQMADAIGVPVLASVPVTRASDAAGWVKLLEDYRPSVVAGWHLRNALRHLGFGDVNLTGTSARDGSSLAVITLSADRKALALGPQLAVYAASLGIPTALVVGPQQDANATATLRAACGAPAPSNRLRIAVSNQHTIDRIPGAALTIVVAVVDGEEPRVDATMHTVTTVLGVSAGAVTAEQLARVAASAATDGREVAGILVADPDPADHTTGRLPQLTRPAHRKMPTRVTDVPTETRRRAEPPQRPEPQQRAEAPRRPEPPRRPESRRRAETGR